MSILDAVARAERGIATRARYLLEVRASGSTAAVDAAFADLEAHVAVADTLQRELDRAMDAQSTSASQASK